VGALDETRRIEIRNERLHRLRLLELRQARQGVDTPPDVIIEIETTRAELGMSDLLLAEKASGEFAEEIGREGQFLILTRLIAQVGQQINTQGKMLSERIDRVEEHTAMENDRQDNERRRGQQRTRLALFAAAVALGVLAGAVIYVVAVLNAHGFTL
jgi:hypothetical protein